MLEDKICGFNVNEFHLVTMIMPYIYEKINEEKKITTFWEKDLSNIYEKIVNINNLYWKSKKKLDEIDWKKTETDKLAEKFDKESDIVIVAGSKDFINRINSLVINFSTKFTLVNCFEIDDFNDNLKNITKNYSKILCTNGIRETKELYFV